MESSKTGNALAHHFHQMMHNKILLLTVLLAVGAAAYFGIGLYMMLRH